MRFYLGERTDHITRVYVAEPCKGIHHLPLYRNLRDHSPTGFNWGYGGSGPAQLALALAAHATGEGNRAMRVYQRLKTVFVSRISLDHWMITDAGLINLIESIEAAGVGLEEPDSSPSGD